MANHTEAGVNDEWARTLYQEAIADIRWAKERGWTLMYAAVVFVGALYALTVGRPGGVPDSALLPIAAALLLASWATVVWMINLNDFGGRARARAHAIMQECDVSTDVRWPINVDPNHIGLLVFQVLVVVTAGAVLWTEVLRIAGLLAALIYVAILTIVFALTSLVRSKRATFWPYLERGCGRVAGWLRLRR